jgi:hypothetical protein
MRDTRVSRSRHLHKLPRRHFIIFDVLPFLGTLLAIKRPRPAPVELSAFPGPRGTSIPAGALI